MPAKQTVLHEGLRFQTEPAFWVRRLLNWPFYFENYNPSFNIAITQLDPPELPTGKERDRIYLGARFPDQSSLLFPAVQLPDLKKGATLLYTTPHILTPTTGHTVIRLQTTLGWPARPPDRPAVPAHWETLYTYRVRPQEHLWIGAATAALVLLQLLLSAINALNRHQVLVTVTAPAVAVTAAPSPALAPPPTTTPAAAPGPTP